MSKPSARQERILAVLRSRGSARVAELAPEFDVSPITLRRDVEALARDEQVVRGHGVVRCPRPAAVAVVRVHNHGSDHLNPWDADGGDPDPLYARLAYFTRTGPTAVRNAPDNHIALHVRGRESVRRRIHPIGSGPGWVASWHQPQFPGPRGGSRAWSSREAHGRCTSTGCVPCPPTFPSR